VLGLAEEAAAGDRPAIATFEDLLSSCSTPAFHLACAMLGDAQEAEDAVQEAAVKAWRHFNRFRHDASFQTWFLAIVANQCRSMRRTRGWQMRRGAELPEVPLASHEASTVRRMDVQSVVARLPREQRALLYLYFALDLPQAEIGQILHVRTGTVKIRLHRVMAQLRRALEDE
jgi:RNA polymerase sigma-70 factor (ECF subfamily)